MTTEQQEQYLKWLDEEIEKEDEAYYASPKWDRSEYAAGRSEAYADAKKKFIELFKETQQTKTS